MDGLRGPGLTAADETAATADGGAVSLVREKKRVRGRFL